MSSSSRAPAKAGAFSFHRWQLAVLACALVACHREQSMSRGQFRGAPVILISIDTLRSDRLPAYGYANVKTPAIDALAAEGVIFERAYSNVPLTLPSHTSMLTGVLPPKHGVRNNLGYLYDAKKHPPITAALKTAGYESAAMVSAYVLRGNSGLGGAFDVYDDAITSEAGVALGRLQRAGPVTLKAARSWIDGRRERPFFLLFHIFEPHAPYDAPSPFRERYSDSYDAEIATADDVVGQLFKHLQDIGLYDRSIIILTSDHGEGLNDHGEAEHGVFLYREALQVPLIIKLPRSSMKGRRISSPVELTDIAPTIAFLTGVDAPPGATGINLFDEDALQRPRTIYSETLYPRLHLGWSELRSLIDGRYHFIEAPRPELYDMTTDAAEKTNVISSHRRVYAALREQLQKHGRSVPAPAAVDPEETAKLEALGYVGSMKTSDGPLPDPKDHIAEVAILQDASRLAAGGQHNEAAELLKQLLTSNPRFTDAWAKLGSIYEAMARYDDALDAYKHGLNVSPASSAEFALSISGLLIKLRRFDDARKHAELALIRNPAGGHQLLARVALEEGKLDVAEREARLAMIDEAAKPRAMVTLGQIRAKQGRTAEAIQILEAARTDAMARQMRVEHLELALADVYARIGRLAEAENAFRREIEMFPSNLRAYSGLSVVLVLQKKFDDVDRVLDVMAQRNPSRQAYLVAAETYEALGDTNTASQWRSRAAKTR